MPEAAIHEHGNAGADEGDVGPKSAFASPDGVIDSKPETLGVQKGAKATFGLGVTAAYRRHVPRARLVLGACRGSRMRRFLLHPRNVPVPRHRDHRDRRASDGLTRAAKELRISDARRRGGLAVAGFRCADARSDRWGRGPASRQQGEFD